MNQQSEITPEGLKKLEEQIEHLETERRREIGERIKEAREFGDISENSEYDTAKDEQAQNEAEIVRLRERLRRSRVVTDTARDTKRVSFGSIVHLEDDSGKGKRKVQIVGSTEADLSSGKLSIESPIGSALIGAERDQEVTVRLPQGEKKFRVTRIEAA